MGTVFSQNPEFKGFQQVEEFTVSEPSAIEYNYMLYHTQGSVTLFQIGNSVVIKSTGEHATVLHLMSFGAEVLFYLGITDSKAFSLQSAEELTLQAT